MAKNTKLETLVNKLIKVSITGGKLNTAKIKEVTKTLSNLPPGSAIKSLELYLNALKRELDRHRLVIESPVNLSNEQISKISDIVSNSTPIYDTEVIINPRLIAGFKIKIGDEVYEDSVEDRVRQLQEVINE